MGIPSYFVHVVRTYPNIVKLISELHKGVHNLYMDCNGIIYDAVRVHTMSDFKASGAFTKQDMYERAILNHVCDKITEYVAQVKPTNRVFLTFDGVAPVAKLNQQRERRYKTWFTSEMEREFEKPTASSGASAGAGAVATVPVMRNEDSWTTACITPGTAFMSKLHERMSEYVDTQKRNKCDASASAPAALQSRLPDFMLSSSSEPGEGEHKIFEFIRENPDSHRDQTTMVYGLDADLIMLTLNHLHISNGIYLYRETPEFIQSVDARLKPNEQYYMDIPYMAECIARYMTTATITGTSTSGGADAAKSVEIPPTVKKHLVYDYIFMFFMMGNDFMPHFPSMNIRTTGPDTVMNAYKITFQNTLSASNVSNSTNRSFIRKARGGLGDTDTLAIDWASVRDFVQCLSEVEHQNLIAEHTLRDKRARATSSGFRYEPVTTTTGPNNALLHTIGNYGSQCELLLAKCKNATDMLHIPSKERGIEHYIAPVKSGWEQRYYLALFGEKITDRRCQEYCINYLEGLEWTFQYYTRGCVDWRWRYKYAYPPLLADLVRFIPTDTTAAPTVLLAHKPKDPIQPVDQLRYVLPPAFQSALIPVSAIPIPVPTLQLTDVRFKWAYCKYFWEAHIVL
jgi:5'-3' exoribonuclease 1